jgi:hypothetical protein
MLNLAAGLPLSSAELALAQTATDDDIALLNACLELEAELREQAWAPLERVLAFAAELYRAGLVYEDAR